MTVERIKMHGASLEGNLEGEAVDRDVLVFLPPGYARDRSRRYPVVYALHGYSIGAEQWSKEIHVPQTIEGAFAKGAQETIVVLPDSKTVYNGSMYSSSADDGRLRELRCARSGCLYGFALPDHRQAYEPGAGGAFDGRLRRQPDRDEAFRRVWQPVHNEPVLHVGARRGARQSRHGKGDRGSQVAGRSG